MFKALNIKNSIKIKNLKLKILLTSCILFLISFWGSVGLVGAQSQYPEGITVVPSIMHIDLALDPPEYELKYINNTASEISLEISVQDFTELE